MSGRPPAPNSTAELRNCSIHGIIEFHRYSGGKRGFRWKCKRCAGEAVTRRHQKLKRILVAEAGGACVTCGYRRCVVNLHFHHVDPALKSFGVTTSRGKSIAAYREEAKKCVLVCANCHGEIEAGIRRCPPAGTKYGEWPTPEVSSGSR
jgi:hypothetical protein